MGARLVEINAISQNVLPQLDALYIGGGFPEIQAQALADNHTFRNALREEIEKGLPVYAECGGFMYLGKNLVVDGRPYPMVGAIPVEFVLKKRPQGHGYTVLEVNESNPYYPVGEMLKGHEFHYSNPVLTGEANVDFVFKVRRGHGKRRYLHEKRPGYLHPYTRSREPAVGERSFKGVFRVQEKQ